MVIGGGHNLKSGSLELINSNSNFHVDKIERSVNREFNDHVSTMDLQRLLSFH